MISRKAYFIVCVIVAPLLLVIGAAAWKGLSGGAAAGMIVPLMLCGLFAYWRATLNDGRS